ncbi:MAG: J domain-containing protein [Nostocales cyanobacterium]|nr:MAG: J domain-containing protein [Nostocales cyanobacterium]TAF20144.1 MAG: J domain-containing protein [Nostocales cyanobacterium]
MSLTIDGGLFKFDFTDYHAVLCVPVDASAGEVRKRYLKIARRLHPDSSTVATNHEEEIANQLLSKLVNPAYEKLSVERNRAEYSLILSQIGKRLAQESGGVQLMTDVGKQLATAPNFELLYRQELAKLAENQYGDLYKTTQLIAQISELNLVFLMRSAGKVMTVPQPVTTQGKSVQSKPVAAPPPQPKPQHTKDSLVEQYQRRAQTLIESEQFTQAKVELQEALKLDPKNGRCHSLVAMVYLRQNQLKMAKIHFDNALKLDPNEKLALAWKPKVDQALGVKPGAQVKKSADHESTQPDKSGSGGLFGGLFGGKKK